MSQVCPDPYSIALEDLDPSAALLFQSQEIHAYFKRLREEDPVHFVNSKEFGPYWSITRFDDIKFVDTHHNEFSSEPDIVIGEKTMDAHLPMFISMDRPKHDEHRKVVQPAVAQPRLDAVTDLIRERVGKVLDELPVGETFNWVDRVSIELTTMMLATLFDFPFEDRHKLPYWSDIATSTPATGVSDVDLEKREEILMDCLATFTELLERRRNEPAKEDFLSLMAHHPSMAHLDPRTFLGTLILLIVGGNDTTRNSMSASVVAMNQFPEELAKLKANPDLITSMVPELVRWQTPLAHMRRIAKEDVELNGKTIKKGDKVVMWYLSGNRDDSVISDPEKFIIDRENPRNHVAFGYGIHRCMGSRLAELQLRILWEELLKRFERIELVGEPERVLSNFVHGYSKVMVRLHPLAD
jgi:cytochrome P450